MSCDFGVIPLPYSPLQDYFDRRYGRISGNTSPISPTVSSPLGEQSSVEEQFAKALAALAKKQDAEDEPLSPELSEDSKSTSARTDNESMDGAGLRRESLATSSGYAAMLANGLLKRRSVSACNTGTSTTSRQP
ncbi:hypothetical protein LTR09_010983 [Extremus antarcticus]|uniref:Uncharacterized protein n=1 Tax=Extremus antarcticus TaxID=702011 RepID=A0AAJ0D6S4_9PEZI|nr:hypothetical protein LTR09_010983 [Extremus antarcticus]